jgi:hypothetical protein
MKKESIKKEKCIECGCTENRACAGGCSWVAPNYCSACTTDNALKERFITHWRKTFGSYDGRELEPMMIFQLLQREKNISGAIGYSNGLAQAEDIQDYRIKSPRKKSKGQK